MFEGRNVNHEGNEKDEYQAHLRLNARGRYGHERFCSVQHRSWNHDGTQCHWYRWSCQCSDNAADDIRSNLHGQHDEWINGRDHARRLQRRQ
jgi:hypothetical protein